jgi:hypothetical protein
MTGQEALHWRQMSLNHDEDEVKKQFNEWIGKNIPSGVEGEFDHFLAMDDLKSPLVGVVKVSGQLGTSTGKRSFVPGLFFEVNSMHPFVALDARITPIDVEYPLTVEDEVVYKLPAGYAMEGAGPAANVTWPGYAAMRIVPEVHGDAVKVTRTLQYNFTMLDPKTYPELHGFYQKVATADQQQIVLTAIPAAASEKTGNE